jgi:hypothetical protein
MPGQHLSRSPVSGQALMAIRHPTTRTSSKEALAHSEGRSSVTYTRCREGR